MQRSCPEHTPLNAFPAIDAVFQVRDRNIIGSRNKIPLIIIHEQLEIMAATGTAAAECIDLPAGHVQCHMDKAVLIGLFQYFRCFAKGNASGLGTFYCLVTQFINEKTDFPRFVASGIMAPTDAIRQGKGSGSCNTFRTCSCGRTHCFVSKDSPTGMTFEEYENCPLFLHLSYLSSNVFRNSSMRISCIFMMIRPAKGSGAFTRLNKNDSQVIDT
jgi:hypothetical protein